MALLGRKKAQTARQEHKEALDRETAKVKAYRTAEEIVEAAELLVEKAREVRAEIGAISK